MTKKFSDLRQKMSLDRQAALSMRDDAFWLALEAHDGQKDKADRDYIEHLVAVESEFYGDVLLQTVALLHDIVEDTPVTLEDLSKMFPVLVVFAVDALSHRDGESYKDYIARVSVNPIATKVKLADLREHLRPGCEAVISESLIKRYKESIEFLESVS